MFFLQLYRSVFYLDKTAASYSRFRIFCHLVVFQRRGHFLVFLCQAITLILSRRKAIIYEQSSDFILSCFGNYDVANVYLDTLPKKIFNFCLILFILQSSKDNALRLLDSRKISPMLGLCPYRIWKLQSLFGGSRETFCLIPFDILTSLFCIFNVCVEIILVSITNKFSSKIKLHYI